MAGRYQPTHLPETLKHSQASLAQAAVGTLSFLLGPAMHKDLFVPSKLPQSCGSSEIKSHWPSALEPLGILSSSAGSPAWETCCGPVQEFVFFPLLLFPSLLPLLPLLPFC